LAASPTTTPLSSSLDFVFQDELEGPRPTIQTYFFLRDEMIPNASVLNMYVEEEDQEDVVLI